MSVSGTDSSNPIKLNRYVPDPKIKTPRRYKTIGIKKFEILLKPLRRVFDSISLAPKKPAIQSIIRKVTIISTVEKS
jgi:hypothetical protein